jgi:hypothetical protein
MSELFEMLAQITPLVCLAFVISCFFAVAFGKLSD